MAEMLFCNVGWMNRYEGLSGKSDPIRGGGSYVREHRTGGEICNFLICRDGYVYGHVETMKGPIDRKIRIESIGGFGDAASGIDVIWTASDPNGGGRKVVGYYRNATVFRERKSFPRFPSRQHRRDGVRDYRIRALADDVRRFETDERDLSLGRGSGWMGHTPWWMPTDSSPPDVRQFLDRVRRSLVRTFTGVHSPTRKAVSGRRSGGNTPGAAVAEYIRYVEAYEIRISPRHDTLQKRFERFLISRGATDIHPNVASVDLRFRHPRRGFVLTEIKPCDVENTRYAIRTAIGQLLDYRQRERQDASLLIVLDRKPVREDQALAISNGFGLAYPSNETFSPDHSSGSVLAG